MSSEKNKRFKQWASRKRQEDYSDRKITSSTDHRKGNKESNFKTSQLNPGKKKYDDSLNSDDKQASRKKIFKEIKNMRG